MEDERLQQEKALKKRLKDMMERRRLELRKESRKEVDEKTEQMRELRAEIDRARMMAFAESAGTSLEDAQRRKAVDLANELRDPTDPLEQTPYDRDTLQVQRAKHQRENELAEKRIEVELDEELAHLQQDLEKGIAQRTQSKRDEWLAKLKAAQNDPALYEKLKREMEEWERNVAEQNEAEKFKQEHKLQQKRQQRDNLIKIRMMALE